MGLLDTIKQLPTLNELKGGFGEQLAKYYSKTMTDALVLHDILITGSEGYTSQIDLIIIGVRGIYTVEVKNFQGAKIYGDGNKSKWYYYRGGKKFEIYNPIKQNKKHIEYLKIFLSDFGTIPFFSIILLLCDDFKTTNVNSSEECTTIVCNSLPAMNKGIQLIAKDKSEIFDEDTRKKIFDYISNNQIIGKEARKEHKENVKAYIKALNEMEEQKICPHCKVSLVLRQGKFGEFYGCSNYPKCRYILKK